MWSHIHSLTLLTHLAFKGWSVPAHWLPDLACVPGLVSLRLPDQELCSPTFHAPASLPSLRELQARRSNPDTDLRHLHCSWTKLTLDEVRSPPDLAWLPGHGLHKLQLSDTMTFELREGDDRDATFAFEQQAASAITAMAHQGLLVVNRIAGCMQWDTVPQQPCSQLLAALGPSWPSPIRAHSGEMAVGCGGCGGRCHAPAPPVRTSSAFAGSGLPGHYRLLASP